MGGSTYQQGYLVSQRVAGRMRWYETQAEESCHMTRWSGGRHELALGSKASSPIPSFGIGPSLNSYCDIKQTRPAIPSLWGTPWTILDQHLTHGLVFHPEKKISFWFYFILFRYEIGVLNLLVAYIASRCSLLRCAQPAAWGAACKSLTQNHHISVRLTIYPLITIFRHRELINSHDC